MKLVIQILLFVVIKNGEIVKSILFWRVMLLNLIFMITQCKRTFLRYNVFTCVEKYSYRFKKIYLLERVNKFYKWSFGLNEYERLHLIMWSLNILYYTCCWSWSILWIHIFEDSLWYFWYMLNDIICIQEVMRYVRSTSSSKVNDFDFL